MSFFLHVTSIDIKLIDDKAAVHRAMAERYLHIVQGNFGPNGQHRPTVWKSLRPSYVEANKRKDRRTPWYVGTIPTLYRTGRLFNSIKAAATEASGVVWTFNPYAAAQQFGRPEINLPPRPFFPFYRDGRPTEFAVQEVTKAAEGAIGLKR